MTWRPLHALTAAVCAAWLTLSGVAGAEPDPKAEAKAEFDRGLALSKEKQYEAALKAFLHSRELFPTRANTQNAALMLKLLGRYDESIAMLEDMLRELPDLTDEQRAAVERELDELAGEVGSVTVTTAEPGAEVELDGEPSGKLPLAAALRVNPGRHRVVLRRADGAVAETFVDVAARQQLSIGAVTWNAPASPERPTPSPPTPPPKREPTPEPKKEGPPTANATLALGALLLFEPFADDELPYARLGPGYAGSISLTAHYGSGRFGAFFGYGVLSVKDCSPPSFADTVVVECSGGVILGGIQAGGVLESPPFEVEIAARYGESYVWQTQRVAVDSERNTVDSRTFLGLELSPRYRLTRAWALGGVVSYDTSLYARLGATVALDF